MAPRLTELEQIAAAAEELGWDIPRALAEWYDAHLDAANGDALLAWQALAAARPGGFGVGGIPLTEIEAWCRLRGRAFTVPLVRKIQALDTVFRKQLEKSGGRPGSPPNPGRAPKMLNRAPRTRPPNQRH